MNFKHTPQVWRHFSSFFTIRGLTRWLPQPIRTLGGPGLGGRPLASPRPAEATLSLTLDNATGVVQSFLGIQGTSLVGCRRLLPSRGASLLRCCVYLKGSLRSKVKRAFLQLTGILGVCRLDKLEWGKESHSENLQPRWRVPGPPHLGYRPLCPPKASIPFFPWWIPVLS